MKEDVDYATHKKGVGQKLLGIRSNVKRENAFLPDGDISGNSMARATSFERVGEYKKAINCWKRIQILHDDDKTIIKRAKKRIKTLERKLLSKRRGLKEGSSGEVDKPR